MTLWHKLTRKLLFAFFDRWKKLTIPLKTKRVLIVKLDAIGDYVLFRNFAHAIKTDPKWQGHSFTLLGNPAFKQLAEHFDQQIFDKFIWVSPSNLYDREKLTRLVLRLKLLCFDVVINTHHSRMEHLDLLVTSAGAKRSIASSGDAILFGSKEQKENCDRWYDEIVTVPANDTFEFFRNQVFYNSLKSKKQTVALSLPVEVVADSELPLNSVVIFPGAGAKFRQWPSSRFRELISLIHQRLTSDCSFVICGASTDSALASEIIEGSAPDIRLIDLTGKTTLVQLVTIIGRSRLLVSNETSAVHIAAATNTPAVCVSNGNHFQRFNPYPPTVAKKISTVYPDIGFYTHNGSELTDLVEECSLQSNYDITRISVDEVLNAVELVWDFQTEVNGKVL